MDLLPRQVPTGQWGEQFESGVVDGMLEAALTANDCAQAFAAAYHVEYATNQQIRDAELADERSTAAIGVRTASAGSRYSAVTEYADALPREWARHALHLARIAAAARLRLSADPAARISRAELQLADVAALFTNPSLLGTPSPAMDAPAGDDTVDPAPRISGCSPR